MEEEALAVTVELLSRVMPECAPAKIRPADPGPMGAIALAAYYWRGHVVVLGVPRDDVPEDSPDAHNCDAMGCGQRHVIARVAVDAATSAVLSAVEP